jgi:NAD(P)-dependent dehydrogenase (short-subunit alcohol dehydrogenase family)
VGKDQHEENTVGSVLDRFRLDGKVALVTGGAKGLGEVFSSALASAGAMVALTSRSLEHADRQAHAILQAHGGEVLPLAADVTRRGDAEATIDRVLDRFGRLDILLNNAGVNVRGPIEQLSEDDWDLVVDTNLKGAWLFCRAAAGPMKQRKWGRVINVSSMLGEISMPNRTPYASSKGGLTLLTKTLALEWAAHGINVNALCPGPFATEINVPLLNDPAARAQIEANVPLGRWGDPAELGPAVVFLASEASSFMTGATLFIDGGYTAR